MVEGPGSGAEFLDPKDKHVSFSQPEVSEIIPNGSVAEHDAETDLLKNFEYPKRPKKTELDEFNKKILGDPRPMREIRPLGLRLSTSSAFQSLIEKRLHNSDSSCFTNTPTKSSSEKGLSNDYMSQPLLEKLKASNFPALQIQIGTWERTSQFEGELVAKCYFAKKKLVWEILNGGLKSKIEIPWSEILAIRASMNPDELGMLEVELGRPPNFYQETDPQPRKHTMWQSTADFTDGQASLNRRHKLIFLTGTMDRHYEKLMHFDPRLFLLSQKPFPSLSDPFFSQDVYVPNVSLNLNSYEPPQFQHQIELPSLPLPSWYPYQTDIITPATMPPLNPDYPMHFFPGTHFPIDNGTFNPGLSNQGMPVFYNQMMYNAVDTSLEPQGPQIHTLPLVNQFDHQTFPSQQNQQLIHEHGVHKLDIDPHMLNLAQPLLSDSQKSCYDESRTPNGDVKETSHEKPLGVNPTEEVTQMQRNHSPDTAFITDPSFSSYVNINPPDDLWSWFDALGQK